MKCPLVGLLTKCSCYSGAMCLFCVQLTLSVMAMVFGALIAWQPKKTIELQMALYRPFNWRLEPISMEKEIRNTRIMGVALLIIGTISLVYSFF